MKRIILTESQYKRLVKQRLNEQKIADKLGINLTTVEKIIKICLMKSVENKTVA